MCTYWTETTAITQSQIYLTIIIILIKLNIYNCIWFGGKVVLKNNIQLYPKLIESACAINYVHIQKNVRLHQYFQFFV